MFIGNIKLENPFIAAPLAGISDAPTRTIFRAMGASLVYSEMISGKGLIFNNHKTEELLKINEFEKPVAFQIFGNEVEVMEETARLLEKRENSILDINMGCPVPKVVKNNQGSALLKNVDQIFKIVDGVSKTTKKPLTVKIRIGWDENTINCVEVAKAIEAGGASAVTVHGRTREQYYSGKANWNYIRAVKEAVKIPVIGNGDVFTARDALNMIAETGCDFVMIGRGMLGNPWIFRECLHLWKYGEELPKPSSEEKKSMMIKHLLDLVEFKGEKLATREMRKHFGWYTKGMKDSACFRREVNQVNTSEEMVNLIKKL